MKTLNWQQKQFAHLPDPRTGSILVGNTKTRSLMLFGGVGGPRGRLNDTWVFDQNGWKKNADTADLPPRSDMGFAYDDSLDVLLIFGGYGNGGPLEDTWVFDGHTWKQQQTGPAPSPRAGAKLAFDVQRKLAVLFGGTTVTAANRKPVILLGDTWQWNGSVWQQVSSDVSPGPRSNACMVYDASRQVVVLFGGNSEKKLLNDIWAWDGTNWNMLQPAHAPSPRVHAAMVYNPVSQQVVLFGGQTADGSVNDTWLWDGQDWSPLETQTRPPLDIIAAPQMCYLPGQDNIILLATRIHKPSIPSPRDPLKVWSEIWVLE